MFKTFLAIATLIGLQSAFAGSPIPCSAQAQSEVMEKYMEGRDGSDVQLLVRTFSAREDGNNITIHVRVVDNGSYSMETITLRKSNCEIVSSTVR